MAMFKPDDEKQQSKKRLKSPLYQHFIEIGFECSIFRNTAFTLFSRNNL